MGIICSRGLESHLQYTKKYCAVPSEYEITVNGDRPNIPTYAPPLPHKNSLSMSIDGGELADSRL